MRTQVNPVTGEKQHIAMSVDEEKALGLQAAPKMAEEMGGEVPANDPRQQVVSQVGRPDDGTDTTTFNNIEFQVDLKPPSSWKTARGKNDLIQKMNQALRRYPGVAFNFSQNI